MDYPRLGKEDKKSRWTKVKLIYLIQYLTGNYIHWGTRKLIAFTANIWILGILILNIATYNWPWEKQLSVKSIPGRPLNRLTLWLIRSHSKARSSRKLPAGESRDLKFVIARSAFYSMEWEKFSVECPSHRPQMQYIVVHLLNNILSSVHMTFFWSHITQ